MTRYTGYTKISVPPRQHTGPKRLLSGFSAGVPVTRLQPCKTEWTLNYDLSHTEPIPDQDSLIPWLIFLTYCVENVHASKDRQPVSLTSGKHQ